MKTERKVYVNVEVEFTEEGRLVPKKIRWNDGREWIVDRLIHSSEISPGKGSFEGIRYTVLIGGAEKYIYERHGRWYVIPADKEVVSK